MRVIIMAAGRGTRWNNYLGVPKQLAKIDGEPILYRTIRLLKENGITDIAVTVSEKNCFGDLLGAKEIVGKSELELDRFKNAEKNNPDVILYGDVFYTEKAIKTILSTECDKTIFFGRSGNNLLTGKKHGELLAVKTDKAFFKKVNELYEIAPSMSRCIGWELYNYVVYGEAHRFSPQKKMKEKGMLKDFIEINDWTDDFDYPIDYDNFIERYERLVCRDS